MKTKIKRFLAYAARGLRKVLLASIAIVLFVCSAQLIISNGLQSLLETYQGHKTYTLLAASTMGMVKVVGTNLRRYPSGEVCMFDLQADKDVCVRANDYYLVEVK